MVIEDLEIRLRVIALVMTVAQTPMMMTKIKVSRRSLKRMTWTMSRGMRAGTTTLGTRRLTRAWTKMSSMMMTRKTRRDPMMIHKMIWVKSDLTIRMKCHQMHFRAHSEALVAHKTIGGRLMWAD